LKVVRSDEFEFEAASHEDPRDPGVLKKVLASKDDFSPGTIQMLNWSVCPKGSSFRKHYHEDMQEVFVIMDGNVLMQVETETVQLTAGDAILIDAGEVHKMTNTCDRDVNYLVFGISAGRGGKTVVVED